MHHSLAPYLLSKKITPKRRNHKAMITHINLMFHHPTEFRRMLSNKVVSFRIKTKIARAKISVQSVGRTEDQAQSTCSQEASVCRQLAQTKAYLLTPTEFDKMKRTTSKEIAWTLLQT